jgi:hypothetical protein
MRLLQVGAIDLATPVRQADGLVLWRARSRPGLGNIALWRRAIQVNRPYLLLFFGAILLCAHDAFAEKGKGKGGKKKQAAAAASVSPGEESLTNIPLPIGHEAKGLVLPDFDGEGHLRGKFEAGTARRLDQEHIRFNDLKITTYSQDKQTDLTIQMSESMFDLKTRILSSKEHTTVKRADFNIVGDSVEFDTNTRTGKLVGNVKMVITDQSRFKPNATE